jgi:hypothetical protein
MQFDNVETAGTGAPPACARCRRPLDEYFALGGHMLCGGCANGYSGAGGAPFWRALLFGAGAAVIGAIAWYAIYKATNSEFGLLGIVVGLFVGVAVRRGSRGRGGWRYQALAMVLTYLSITTSYVPVVLQAAVEQAKKTDASEPETAQPDTAEGAAAGDSAPAPAVSGKPAGRPSAGAAIVALLFLFGVALAMPFLSGASNIMGFIIIGIALYEAWKINRRLPISGPFRLGGALSVPSPLPMAPGMPPPAAGT